MEVKVELPTNTATFLTAPSSPTAHPLDDLFFFYSAPSSPKPTPPDSDADADADDFQFDFSGHLVDRPSLSAADELFHCGKIRPLRPPPARLQLPLTHSQYSTPSSSSDSPILNLKHNAPDFDSSRRGRPKHPAPAPRKGISRSLSPLRVSEFALQQQQHQDDFIRRPSSSSSKVYKKWKLKDLLLFRSASEGRPNPKLHPITSPMTNVDDAMTSSFRSSYNGVGEGSSRRRSAHELHYAANRAVSHELKKKTTLPFKYGLFGCLGFSHSSSSAFQDLSLRFPYSSR